MASPWRMCVLVLLTAAQEAGSQKWKDDPKDGLVIHKCATQNVTFSWEIEPEEGVIAISWTQIKGEARTNIADYYDGKFSTKKSNLEQVGLAGIKLSNLFMEDSATYIVNVKLKDLPLMTRSVNLSLSEPPQLLKAQEFHINLSTLKEMTSSTDAQAVLTDSCGVDPLLTWGSQPYLLSGSILIKDRKKVHTMRTIILNSI
ncbi:uncharacterized protein LOC112568119 [Pomacea canaliculata]|uniref:uncharacterized protein LOC112568119 n=1 Tax=Pomacea canaliculata TaxID=400727 RepID=UPI000D72F948|nr:uncharacterized protein LOC112568119 [Pomacea canaliculata]